MYRRASFTKKNVKKKEREEKIVEEVATQYEADTKNTFKCNKLFLRYVCLSLYLFLLVQFFLF